MSKSRQEKYDFESLKATAVLRLLKTMKKYGDEIIANTSFRKWKSVFPLSLVDVLSGEIGLED